MTSPPSPTPRETPQPKEHKQSGLFKTVMLGLATSLVALASTMWLFAYQATLGKPAWVWIPPIEPNEMFEVIRNAVTAVAALGVGVTLFLSYRKQRTTEQQLQATLDANSNAVDALDHAKSEHKDALKQAMSDRAEAQRQYFLDQNLTRESLQQTKDSLALAQKQHGSDAMDKLRSRYSTAAEQIGSSNASLAVAGMISMASVADEWHRLNRIGDRDDCMRMLVAGLPSADDNRADTQLIRATCQSLFDQRMSNSADRASAWWKAEINFRISTGIYGPIRGWVLEGNNVRFRADQLAAPETPAVRDITIDGGILDINMGGDTEGLHFHNADLRLGGINLSFDGRAIDQDVKLLFTSLQGNGGRIILEDNGPSAHKKILRFRHCDFTEGCIVLPSLCDRYELVFNRCNFLVSPFRYLNHIRGAPPTIRFNGENYFTGPMEVFPIDSPEKLLSPEFRNLSVSQEGAQSSD